MSYDRGAFTSAAQRGRGNKEPGFMHVENFCR